MRINDLNKITNEAEADDLYHDNVKKVGQKDYNDYKGIQIHNLEKELKQVRKILLNLQDIESRDNSSDMVNDIRNMLGGYQDLLDSMESAFDKLRTGRHRKESVKEDDEERGAEHYREKDKQHTDHVKAELEEIMSHLDQAITYRWENSHLFFNNGDKAGAGEMYRMADKLKELHAGWDKSTELYGM